MTLLCTNDDCDTEINHDPGAQGRKCPKCGKGAWVPEGSEMLQ